MNKGHLVSFEQVPKTRVRARAVILERARFRGHRGTVLSYVHRALCPAGWAAAQPAVQPPEQTDAQAAVQPPGAFSKSSRGLLFDLLGERHFAVLQPKKKWSHNYSIHSRNRFRILESWHAH